MLNKKIIKRVNRAAKHNTLSRSIEELNIERAIFTSTIR